MMDGLLALLLTCAPMVHPDTSMRLVKHESGGQPYAVNINGPYRLAFQPQNKAAAVTVTNQLLQMGVSVDVGLAQINSRNFQKLGLTVESAFEPCTNVQAMQTVLLKNYTEAKLKHRDEQVSLRAALSEYNTGNQVAGLKNGYVDKVYRTKP